MSQITLSNPLPKYPNCYDPIGQKVILVLGEQLLLVISKPCRSEALISQEI